jgi:hypothetical protein
MSTQNLHLKLTRVNALKLKVMTKFPATVAVQNFLTVAKANGIYTFSVDYTALTPGPILDPTTAMVAVLDETAGIYRIVSLSSVLASTSQIEQHITAAGPVTISNNAGIVRVDQTVGAAITLNMPLASAKTCPVLISDWKADSDVNPITVNLTGADKFPGGLTSWTINAQGASIFLRPIAGVGYAL